MRNSSFVEAQLSPTLEGNKRSHIQFQMIKYEDLQWVRRFDLRRLLEKPHTQTHTAAMILALLYLFITLTCDVTCSFSFAAQGESLGQGSFTRLFKGYKSDLCNGGKHVSVFLKELDVNHRNLWEVGLLPLKRAQIPTQDSRCNCQTLAAETPTACLRPVLLLGMSPFLFYRIHLV